MQKQFLTALVLGAGTILGAPVMAGSAKPVSFDGTWSVRLVTASGSCDPSYTYTIAIQDGRVRPLSSGDAAVSGGVASDGSVTIGVRRSLAQADASGRLRSGNGSGQWRVSMLGCTGTWTAQRHAQQVAAN